MSKDRQFENSNALDSNSLKNLAHAGCRANSTSLFENTYANNSTE